MCDNKGYAMIPFNRYTNYSEVNCGRCFAKKDDKWGILDIDSEIEILKAEGYQAKPLDPDEKLVEEDESEPLTEEEYLDIVETKKKKEKEATDAFRANMSEYETSTEGYYTKIYQIDCSSSVIKFFSFATIFLALLF